MEMTKSELYRRLRAIRSPDGSEQALAAAAVLVDGASISSAARERGLSAINVSRLVRRLRSLELCPHCGAQKNGG